MSEFNSEEFIDHIEHVAREIVSRTGSHAAIAFVITDAETDGRKNIAVIQSPAMAGDEDKDRFTDIIRQTIEQHGGEEYLVVVDAWVLPKKIIESLPKEDVRAMRPSQHPERESCITMLHVHKTKGMSTRMFRYEQVAEERWACDTTERMDGGDQYSRFSIWGPTKTIEEKDIDGSIPQKLRKVAKKQIGNTDDQLGVTRTKKGRIPKKVKK